MRLKGHTPTMLEGKSWHAPLKRQPLTWRPFHLPPAEDVDVQVIDTLPALRMRVDDGAKTLPCDAFLLGDTLHKPQHLTKESVRCLENSGNPPFGDDQDMHRRLRIPVAKRKGILGLGDPPVLRHGLKRELSRIQGSYLFVGDLSDADRGAQ